MARIELQDLRKRLGPHEVLKGLDLAIEDGEYAVIVGPSGCGKSTLLRVIAGLEQADGGCVRIGGHDLTHAAPSQRGLAMVFQSYALYPHMTVRENLSFGMRMRGMSAQDIADRVRRAVGLLQLEPCLDRRPGELSGGQCQRVAIGRALVQEPGVFLLDEPLSNLDAELRLRLRLELAELHRQLGRTMVHVTHDQMEAMSLAQRIVVLREGRIEQAGTPMALYERPVNTFVAGFIGTPPINLLPVALRAEGALLHAVLAGAARVELPPALAEAARAAHGAQAASAGWHLGVRPEHLEPDDRGELRLRVQSVERLGSVSHVHGVLAHSAQALRVEWRVAAVPAPGQDIGLRVQAGRLHLFDAGGQRLPPVTEAPT
ncbi:MAG: ABC transporter ATP-binding protein [Rubrivivax sp.]